MNNTSKPTELSVLLYVRVRDPGANLEPHVRALEALAVDRGRPAIGTVGETEPWGPSAAALDAMRAAPAVLTLDLTRLGRDGTGALSLYDALAAAGVRVFSANEGRAAASPAQDALIGAFFRALTDQARRQHSERVRHGLARRREARA